MFFEGSRYRAVETRKIQDDRGRTVRYKAIRFIPPEDIEPRRTHRVQDGERLDHLAHRYYDAPDRFWRICDANEALWPPALVEEPGRELEVPTP